MCILAQFLKNQIPGPHQKPKQKAGGLPKVCVSGQGASAARLSLPGWLPQSCPAPRDWLVSMPPLRDPKAGRGAGSQEEQLGCAPTTPRAWLSPHPPSERLREGGQGHSSEHQASS